MYNFIDDENIRVRFDLGGVGLRERFEANIAFCRELLPSNSLSTLEQVNAIENGLKTQMSYDEEMKNRTLYEGITMGSTVCA